MHIYSSQETTLSNREPNIRQPTHEHKTTMAIDIEWQVRPPQKDSSDTKPRLFPRATGAGVIDEEELAQRISAYGSLSRGTVASVLDDLADVLASLLGEGKEICLPSLGRFRLSIESTTPTYPDTKGSLRNIRVRGVNFQPSEALMQSIGHPSFRLAPRATAIVSTSATDLASQLDLFTQSHPTFSSSEFAQHFHLKRTTAISRLNELARMGVIGRAGSGRHTRYTKNG